MSKFQSTISVVAALASIFGAGAAGWKLAQSENAGPNHPTQTMYEQQITELKEQVSNLQQQAATIDPPKPADLPKPDNQPVVQAPSVPALPSASAPAPTPAPPAPPATGNFE